MEYYRWKVVFFLKPITISGFLLQAEPSLKRLINRLTNAFGRVSFPASEQAMPNSARYITVIAAYGWNDEDRRVNYNLLLRPSFPHDLFFNLEMNMK